MPVREGAVYVSGNFTAVAEPGPVLRSQSTGGSWTRVASQAGNALSGVWSAGRSVYVAGNHGRVLHSADGGATFQSEQLDGKWNAVWASGPRDVYLVGDGGLIAQGR